MWPFSQNDAQDAIQAESNKGELKRLRQELKEIRGEHAMYNREMEHKHMLALQEKDFELRHFKDEQVKTLEDEKRDLQQKVAVLEKEIEMNKQVIDLSGDVLDVKDLVNKLIEKLPNIDLKNITVNQAPLQK